MPIEPHKPQTVNHKNITFFLQAYSQVKYNFIISLKFENKMVYMYLL